MTPSPSISEPICAPPPPAAPFPSQVTEDDFTPPSETSLREPLPTGTVVGEYTIVSKLGQGGFGITYRARHTTQGSIVVIKEHMPSELAMRVPGSTFVTSISPEKEERFKATMAEFMEEVVVLMGLEHPGIVPIISGFEANGTAYYVMPYVEGTSLSLPEHPSFDKNKQAVEARKLKQLLRYLLYTLEYLGQHNIVHRDIKPENIIVNAEGRPILLDFGSARQLQEGKVYTNIYTPDFCSPEQSTARSDAQMSAAIGPWTDIYALGATFYYLITRLLPPKADMRTLSDPDPYKPLAGRANLEELYPTHFLQAIDRALQLPLSERWKRASAWRESMESGMIPPPAGLARRMRLFMTASIVLFVILTSLSIWALSEKEHAMEIYNNSLSFTEGMLYDFNEELSDIPGSTGLQQQLGNNLKDYLNSMEKLPIAQDEKLQRALAIAWKNLGSVNTQQGELAAATEAYRNATKLLQALHDEHPEDSSYRYELARTWLLRADVGRRRNMNEQARTLVSQALNMLRPLCDQSPDNPDYRCELARAMDYSAILAGSAGNHEARRNAINNMSSLYHELVNQYPLHEQARLGLGHALLRQAGVAMEGNDFSRASQLLNDARDIFSVLQKSRPHRLSFRVGLASEAYMRGNMYILMSAQSTDDNQRKENDDLAMAAFKTSISQAQELESLDEFNTDYPFQQCRAMAFMADIMLRRDKNNQAEAYCNTIMRKIDKLLKAVPGNAEYAMIKAGAFRGLGIAHSKNPKYLTRATKDFAQYREITQHHLQKTPGNPMLKSLYADSLIESAAHAIRCEQFKDAKKWLEQAIVLLNDITRNDNESATTIQRLNKARQLLADLPKMQ